MVVRTGPGTDPGAAGSRALFELLVGELPMPADPLRGLPFDEVCRRIREDRTPRPSAKVSAPERGRFLLAERREASRVAPESDAKPESGAGDSDVPSAAGSSETCRRAANPGAAATQSG
ncbi:MAG: hypothetical protein AAGE94_16300 [Acidobacteriota bacterium]